MAGWDLKSVQEALRRYIEEVQETARRDGAEKDGVKIPETLIDRLPALFMNTIDTTVRPQQDGTAFVITGDIEAMWLRDSTAQVYQYLRAAREDQEVASFIRALLEKQFQCILYDPYANAFNESENDRHWDLDEPRQKAGVWEQKYEIDSLVYPLALARRLAANSGDYSFYESELFHRGLETILGVFAQEQDREHSSYVFCRPNASAQDTLSHGGKGAPVRPCGLIFSGFRPSDDACVYGYHVADNLFAAHELRLLRSLDEDGYLELGGETRRRLNQVLKPLCAALETEVYCRHDSFGEIYAYECDGFGHTLFMDDANVPGLLSLPYLGVCPKDDPMYLNTRRAVLSEANPYYFEGKAARGVGSPHTPENYIWPIALTIQALTSEDADEINDLLIMLENSMAGTGYMHEGFHKDRPEEFTRSWFAWANSLLAYLLQELILGESDDHLG